MATENKVSFKLGDDINIVLIARSGGKLQDPTSIEARPGGYRTAGTFDAYTSTMDLTDNADTKATLLALYQRQLADDTIGEATYYEKGLDGSTIVHVFKRAALAKKPTSGVDGERGDEATMTVEWSFNELDEEASYVIPKGQ